VGEVGVVDPLLWAIYYSRNADLVFDSKFASNVETWGSCRAHI